MLLSPLFSNPISKSNKSNIFLFYFPRSFSLSEGEQEEAWLTEAGLAQLFDDSLAADLDQVSIVYPLFK